MQRGGGRGRDAEVGSGAYSLSGVFYLWSKCSLAFLLSTPQMQLDSLLAKQTQMKWLLNDFLSNPPRQHKPSIWSLLSPPSVPPLSWTIISTFLPLIFPVSFPVSSYLICSSFDLHSYIFPCVNPFSSLHPFFCLHSWLLSFGYLFCHQLSFQHQIHKKRN